MKSLLLRTLLSLAIVGGLLALRLVPPHTQHGGLVRVQQTAMGTVWNFEVVDHGRRPSPPGYQSGPIRNSSASRP